MYRNNVQFFSVPDSPIVKIVPVYRAIEDTHTNQLIKIYVSFNQTVSYYEQDTITELKIA